MMAPIARLAMLGHAVALCITTPDRRSGGGVSLKQKLRQRQQEEVGVLELC
jgi:hypothetical protein